jgi:hypothetical protein
LSHANQRQEYEDEAFSKYRSEREIVRDEAAAMEADNLVSEVCVEAHAWC